MMYVLLLILLPIVTSLLVKPQELITPHNLQSTLLSANNPTIQTCAGPIRGFQENGVNKYLGIPYAEPPIGNNRWKATIPKRSWTSTRNATNYSAICPQISAGVGFGLVMNEDCLYLNVFAPSWACEHTGLPVIFWIHGGNYYVGTGNYPLYDGSDLASKSNIVVTINYRLGVLGFLALPELRAEDQHQSTGNYGLNDMQVALQWVQDNIAKFGGDKKKVTIWGESAGCNAVLAHLASPRSHGLFARAICDSGDYTNITNPLNFAYEQGYFLANKTNCIDDSRGVLACLRSQSPDSLVNIFLPCISSTVLPTIDNYQFTDYPFRLINTSSFNNVPLLIGTNKDEGTYIALIIGGIKQNLTALEYPDTIGGAAIGFGYQPSDVSQILSSYPLSSYDSPFQAISDFLSDSIFKCSTLQWLKKYSQSYPTVPLYAYSFNYNQSLFEGLALGATHSSELDFIFHPKIALFQNPPNSAPLADTMQTYWRGFVHNANTNSLNKGNMINWPIYKYPGDQQNIVFDLSLGIERNFDREIKCEVLQSLRVGTRRNCFP